MTVEEIMKMEPGREMDELVESEIFKNKKIRDCETCVCNLHGCIGDPKYPNCYVSATSYYSTNISSAWEVVEKMRKIGIMLTLMNWHYYGQNYYTAKFRNSDVINKEWERKGATAPEAICRAALIACLE